MGGWVREGGQHRYCSIAGCFSQVQARIFREVGMDRMGGEVVVVLNCEDREGDRN